MSASPNPDFAVASPSAAPAMLHIRLLAMVYDLLPLAALWMATSAVMLLLRGGVRVTPGSAAAMVEFVLLLAVTFAYLGLSWRRGGQTLGMRAWRLRLVNVDGSSPVPWRALVLRYLVAMVSLAAVGLGLAWSLLEPNRRTWHDLASGTVMVRMPKPVAKGR
ncbi:RDD family protein [Denitratimonas sp. CY0512]|uniref:RDD family protein n=1 Tax=Denitratimonas sp. CY0512 TaxID=3131940 RepID=UPI0030AEA656